MKRQDILWADPGAFTAAITLLSLNFRLSASHILSVNSILNGYFNESETYTSTHNATYDRRKLTFSLGTLIVFPVKKKTSSQAQGIPKKISVQQKKRTKTNNSRVTGTKSVTHLQFKCKSCEKRQNCYGSRYCQNEFSPVSLVTTRKSE